VKLIVVCSPFDKIIPIFLLICTRKGIKFELPHIFTPKRENLRDVAPLRKFDAKVIKLTPDLSI